MGARLGVPGDMNADLGLSKFYLLLVRLIDNADFKKKIQQVCMRGGRGGGGRGSLLVVPLWLLSRDFIGTISFLSLHKNKVEPLAEQEKQDSRRGLSKDALEKVGLNDVWQSKL
jgi:hypothetical protein